MQGASVDWEWAQALDLRQRSDEWLFLILAAGMGFLVSALLLLLRENPSTGMDLQMIGSRRDQRRLRRLVLPANCVQTVPEDAKKGSRSVAIPGVSDWRTTATDLLHVTAKAAMEKVIPRGREARWSHRQVIPERLNQVDCRPVLVFVNTRSGGQQGFKVMTEMRNYLHTLQVVDLQREGPEAALKWWEKTGLRYRILVCGGDGTVGWVLGALYQLELAYLPPVGILPLGTGNDLARVTGWGGGFTASSVLPVLQRVNEAHAELLDRWTVTSSWLEDLRPSWLTGGTSQVKERRLKPMVMSNYFGIGVDAAVALDFHQMRERRPEWFWSQLVNKLWYFRSGAVAWLAKTCANIGSKIEVHCDGAAVEIPSSLEGIIVLNIPSFGGGTDLWGRAEDEAGDDEDSDSDGSLAPSVSSVGNPSFQGRQSMQDRKLEVVGVHGALQLGASQVGLYKAHRLAQGSSIKVTNKVVLPIEVDGEPMWFAKDGVIEITHQSQAFMLVNSKESSHAVATELVEWAEQQKVINLQQRNTMLKEISRRAGVRAPSSRKKPGSWTRLAPD